MLTQVSRISTPVFYPWLCSDETVMEDFVWSEHRHLYTEEHQQADIRVWEKALAEGAPNIGSNSLDKYLSGADKLITATNSPDAWIRRPDAPAYINLSYGLAVDTITFLDRIAIAINNYKTNPPPPWPPKDPNLESPAYMYPFDVEKGEFVAQRHPLYKGDWPPPYPPQIPDIPVERITDPPEKS